MLYPASALYFSLNSGVSGNLNRLTEIDSWEKNKNRVTFVWHDLKSECHNNEILKSTIGKINEAGEWECDSTRDDSDQTLLYRNTGLNFINGVICSGLNFSSFKMVSTYG